MVKFVLNAFQIQGEYSQNLNLISLINFEFHLKMPLSLISNNSKFKVSMYRLIK